MAGVTAHEVGLALARIASPGPMAFTERQLYYETCRVVRTVALSDAFPHTTEPAIGFEPFREALGAIVAERGALDGLLAGPERAPLPLDGREPDLAAYGLPRLLVCQSDEIARMLRANLFHMEVACAIVAMPVPAPLSDAHAAMLSRARHARVVALHDASPDGLSWIEGVSRRCELPPGARLRPAGLKPVHAMRLQLVARRGARSDAQWAALSATERAWLADGWSAEVTAVPPLRLLRALRRIVLDIVPPPEPEPVRRDAGFMTWP